MGDWSSTNRSEAQPIKQIFILSGQSNMAGRGGVDKYKHWDGVVPPECFPDSQNIFRLDAHLRWETAREPLHHDIDTKKTCGVGPGMSFANAVKERVGKIGLVPCAVGWTAIKEWARGEHLYENMVKRAKEAVNGGEITALLWYQGESDTVSQNEVDTYKENMETFIHNVRSDLNLPNLPVVQVALASGVKKEYVEKIREIQMGIDLPNVVCVDAEGLQLQEDNLHLTTEAQLFAQQSEKVYSGDNGGRRAVFFFSLLLRLCSRCSYASSSKSSFCFSRIQNSICHWFSSPDSSTNQPEKDCSQFNISICKM